MSRLLLAFCAISTAFAWQLGTGTALPHRALPDWMHLPEGWNLGETSGVATDQNDNVWIFHRGPHPIIQLNKSGRYLRSWGDGLIKASHGIRIGPDGGIWAVDVDGHRVLKFSSDGRLRMVLGGVGAQPAKDNNEQYAFNRPTGVAFDSKGNVYVSDGYINSRVVRYSPQGEYLGQWGEKGEGDGQFNLVHDVAVDQKDRVYVADRANRRVQIFDANGRFLGKWTTVGTPWGLVYDKKQDVIYLCDGENNRVVRLNLDGQILGVSGAFGKSPGKFDFAHNIAVDSDGDFYVAEIKNWRVQKFAQKQ